MMKKLLKSALGLIISVIMLSFVFPINAAALEVPDTSMAQNVYLYNFENDKVIYEKNADEKIYPTSTVKMMTGLVALDVISERLEEKITITSAMIKNVQGNRIALEAGEVVTVLDMLYATLAGGANDAASVLAHVCAGGVDEFVTLMNKKAVELGALDTYYTNPNGMHDERMVTTARDTATIAKEAYKSELFMKITSTAKYVMQEGTDSQRNIYNRNYLIAKNKEIKYYYGLAKGMNSGSTNEGGYSLVTTAGEGGLNYLCVVMGAAEDEENIYSYIVATDLLNWAMESYAYISIIDVARMVYEIPVTLSDSVDYVMLVPEKTLEYYLPTDIDAATELTYDYKIAEKSLEAPVYEGEEVGFLTVSYKDQIIGSVNLITKNSVERNEFLYMLGRIKNFTKSRFFKAALIAAILLSVLYIFGNAIYRYKKPRRRRYR